MTNENSLKEDDINTKTEFEKSDVKPIDNSGAKQSRQLNVFAKISQINDRLDLIISAVEEHNPGFIKRASDKIEQYDEVYRQKRFYFGDKQAYTSLALRWIGIIFCFSVSGYVIWQDSVGFWTTTFIIVLLAVSQSGVAGFMKITAGFLEIVRGSRRRD